jgi:hypothetical protein
MNWDRYPNPEKPSKLMDFSRGIDYIPLLSHEIPLFSHDLLFFL